MERNFKLNEIDSEIFLRYFYKKQKDNILESLSGSGQRHINSDGHYEYHLNNIFTIDEEEINVYWIIETTVDNCLLKISTVNTNDDIDKKLSNMIHDCLMQHINKDKTWYFKRLYYSVISGCNLAGEYWFGNIRVAPLFPKDDSLIVNNERIIVIDQIVEAIDNEEASMNAFENAENIISLLSFILDISIEEPVQNHMYFLDKDFNECKREISYFLDNNCPSSMPIKNSICKTANFDGSILLSHENIYHFNEVLKFPKETRRIINEVMKSETNLKNAVLNFSKLYRLSKFVGTRYSTSEIAYQCAGIESIAKFERENSFTSFMNKFYGENKELYDFIYGTLRSGHFHAGEFEFYDFLIKPNIFYNPKVQFTENIKKICHITMRHGFIYWLNSKFEVLK
jgi:hypothetical protein